MIKDLADQHLDATMTAILVAMRTLDILGAELNMSFGRLSQKDNAWPG